MIASLVGSIAATGIFNFFAMKRLEELRWSVFITARSTGEVLRPLFIYVNLFNLLFLSALVIITGIWMLRKMNGPIYRMIKDLNLIREGDFSTAITLRQKDEFRDVAVALNKMLDGMREKFRESREGYEEISQALVEFEIAGTKEIPENKQGDRIIDMICKLREQMLKSSSPKDTDHH